MSNLTGLAINPNVEESTGEFTVLPAGKYKVCIVRDELRDNKNNNGKVLKVIMQVMTGQYAQEMITDYINITNVSPQAQAIGQGVLKRICNICGVPFPPQNTNGLMGKPMVVTLAVEEFQSNNTGNTLKSNKVKKYDYPSATITETAPPVQAQQQPQAASNW